MGRGCCTWKKFLDGECVRGGFINREIVNSSVYIGIVYSVHSSIIKYHALPSWRITSPNTYTHIRALQISDRATHNIDAITTWISKIYSINLPLTQFVKVHTPSFSHLSPSLLTSHLRSAWLDREVSKHTNHYFLIQQQLCILQLPSSFSISSSSSRSILS